MATFLQMGFHIYLTLFIFNDCCESCFIEIEKNQFFGLEGNVVVGVFYTSPNTDGQCFISLKMKINCNLLGDYDINLLNVDTH